MSGDGRIRPATGDDAPALQDIERRAGRRFRDVGMPEIADDDPMPLEQLVAYADAGRSWVAADEAGALVGYVVVDVVDGNAHVEQVTVDPDHQGKGIGRDLLAAVATWALAVGAPALTLTTFRDVPWNAPLYRHLGFRDLEEGELGPQLRRLRDDEAAHGLDATIRVCMRRDVEPRPRYVVVSGPPASGKSTLAPRVATALGLPLVAKDTIKDALMEVLPPPDVAASRQLGRASVRAMLAVAAASPIGAVIESNLYRSIATEELGRLPGPVVELFCRCDRAVGHDRYRRRAGTRHAGHFDHDRTPDELWNDEVAEPVAGGWPVLEVDTNQPVDLAGVLRFVQEHLPR